MDKIFKVLVDTALKVLLSRWLVSYVFALARRWPSVQREEYIIYK